MGNLPLINEHFSLEDRRRRRTQISFRDNQTFQQSRAAGIEYDPTTAKSLRKFV